MNIQSTAIMTTSSLLLLAVVTSAPAFSLQSVDTLPQSSGSFDDFIAVELNDAGRAAIYKTVNNSDSSVVFYDGGSLSTVITENGDSLVSSSMTLNEAGQIAILRNDGSTFLNSVDFFDGTTTITAMDSSGGNNVGSQLVLNNAGQIAVDYRQTSGDAVVDRYDAGTQSTVLAPPSSGVLHPTNFTMNDNGQVASRAVQSASPTNLATIEFSDGTSQTAVMSNPFSSSADLFETGYRLNDNGQVAAVASDGTNQTVEFFDGNSQSTAINAPSGGALVASSAQLERTYSTCSVYPQCRKQL